MQIKCECENNISFRIDSWENRFWYFNNKYHRKKGPPAIYSDGSKSWYKHGKVHRLDGPAYESYTGYREYWIEGKRYSEQEFPGITNASQI